MSWGKECLRRRSLRPIGMESERKGRFLATETRIRLGDWISGAVEEVYPGMNGSWVSKR